MNSLDLREYVIRWNNTFKIDRWWRTKHKVAFHSAQHLEMNFIDMKFEFIEDMMVQQQIDKRKDGSDDLSRYEAGMNDYLNKNIKKYSQKEVDDAFENINLG